jgi:hypothetical protein
MAKFFVTCRSSHSCFLARSRWCRLHHLVKIRDHTLARASTSSCSSRTTGRCWPNCQLSERIPSYRSANTDLTHFLHVPASIPHHDISVFARWNSHSKKCIADDDESLESHTSESTSATSLPCSEQHHNNWADGDAAKPGVRLRTSTHCRQA